MKIAHEFRQFNVDGVTVQVHLDVFESPIGEYSVVKTILSGIGTHTVEFPFRIPSIAMFVKSIEDFQSQATFGEKVEAFAN